MLYTAEACSCHELAMELLEHRCAGTWRKGAHDELVLVADGVLAVGAHVKVLADRAAEALAGLNLHAAGVAGAGEGGRVRVVQVVQHHHAAVLRAPHAVKLVVVALAQRQERLHTHA